MFNYIPSQKGGTLMIVFGFIVTLVIVITPLVLLTNTGHLQAKANGNREKAYAQAHSAMSVFAHLYEKLEGVNTSNYEQEVNKLIEEVKVKKLDQLLKTELTLIEDGGKATAVKFVSYAGEENQKRSSEVIFKLKPLQVETKEIAACRHDIRDIGQQARISKKSEKEKHKKIVLHSNSLKEIKGNLTVTHKLQKWEVKGDLLVEGNVEIKNEVHNWKVDGSMCIKGNLIIDASVQNWKIDGGMYVTGNIIINKAVQNWQVKGDMYVKGNVEVKAHIQNWQVDSNKIVLGNIIINNDVQNWKVFGDLSVAGNVEVKAPIQNWQVKGNTNIKGNVTGENHIKNGSIK